MRAVRKSQNSKAVGRIAEQRANTYYTAVSWSVELQINGNILCKLLALDLIIIIQISNEHIELMFMKNVKVAVSAR